MLQRSVQNTKPLLKDIKTNPEAFILFITNFVRIKTKSGDTVPVVLNECQKSFIRNLYGSIEYRRNV
jgi:hypothetical protein